MAENPTPLTPAQEKTLADLLAQDQAVKKAAADAAYKDQVAKFEPLATLVQSKAWSDIRAAVDTFVPVAAGMLAEDSNGLSHTQAMSQVMKSFEGWFTGKLAALNPPQPVP